MISDESAKEREWLANLKVGDTVIVRTYGFDDGYEIATVDKISEKKRDITIGRLKFRSNGREYNNGYHSAVLMMPTEANLKIVEIHQINREFLRYCHALYEKRRNISEENKIKILKLLKEIL